MGSSCTESDSIDDSGIVHDDLISDKMHLFDSEYKGNAELLDLSDHVLLFILKYCSVQDLKALGFTCSRLASLIVDRTLWQRVDASTAPMGLERMRWMCRHGLCADTTHLSVHGFAKERNPCVGYIENLYGDDAVVDDQPGTSKDGEQKRVRRDKCLCHERERMDDTSFEIVPRPADDPIRSLLMKKGFNNGFNWLNAMTECPMNRCSECGFRRRCYGDPHGSCPGPKYTVEVPMLRQMKFISPKLHTLKLEYCNIDCRKTGLNYFPPSLKRLSLVGTKCYHQSFDNKSFLFKVQDYLIELEELDLSFCDWLEPSSMLPLSKIPSLKRLYMRRCPKMTEFVAYASLATRYGFNKLEVIDLRESPVGDSEVSSFGWLASLLELYACPPPKEEEEIEEIPYKEEELDPWEKEEPDFFKNRRSKLPAVYDDDDKSPKYRRYKDMPGGSSSKSDDDNDDEDGPTAKKKKKLSNVLHSKIENSLGGPDKVNFWFGQSSPTVYNDTAGNSNETRNSDDVLRVEPNIIVISTRPSNTDAVNATKAVKEENTTKNAGIDSDSIKEDISSVKSAIDKGKCSSHSVLGNDVAESSNNSDVITDRDNSVNSLNVNCDIDMLSNVNPVTYKTNNISDTKDVEMSRAKNIDITKSNCESDQETVSNSNITASPISSQNTTTDNTEVTDLEISQINTSETLLSNIDTAEVGTNSVTGKSEITDIEMSEFDSDIQESSSDKAGTSSLSSDNIVCAGTSKAIDGNTEERSDDGNVSLEANDGSETEHNSDSNSYIFNIDSDSKDKLINIHNSKPKRETVLDLSVNDDAGTSNADSKSKKDVLDLTLNKDAGTSTKNDGPSVLFRRNRDPIVVNNDADQAASDRRSDESNAVICFPNAVSRNDAIPRNNIVYVNIRTRLNNWYNQAMPADLFSSQGQQISAVEPTSFVTDSAVYRFGHSDSTPQLVINISPNNLGTRPVRSNLRVLSITGYSTITNRSLMHLATAAPHLRLIDFSRTRVTQSGVDNFTSMRPDCEVIWSEFSDEKSN